MNKNFTSSLYKKFSRYIRNIAYDLEKENIDLSMNSNINLNASNQESFEICIVFKFGYNCAKIMTFNEIDEKISCVNSLINQMEKTIKRIYNSLDPKKSIGFTIKKTDKNMILSKLNSDKKYFHYEMGWNIFTFTVYNRANEAMKLLKEML